MRKNTSQTPGKSLRQRVADRKSGVKQPADPKKEKILGRVKLLANLCQGIGLVMLLVVLAQYINSGYAQMNWINVMIYAGLFLAGRAVTSFLNLTNIRR